LNSSSKRARVRKRVYAHTRMSIYAVFLSRKIYALCRPRM